MRSLWLCCVQNFVVTLWSNPLPLIIKLLTVLYKLVCIYYCLYDVRYMLYYRCKSHYVGKLSAWRKCELTKSLFLIMFCDRQAFFSPHPSHVCPSLLANYNPAVTWLKEKQEVGLVCETNLSERDIEPHARHTDTHRKDWKHTGEITSLLVFTEKVLFCML